MDFFVNVIFIIVLMFLFQWIAKFHLGTEFSLKCFLDRVVNWKQLKWKLLQSILLSKYSFQRSRKKNCTIDDTQNKCGHFFFAFEKDSKMNYLVTQKETLDWLVRSNEYAFAFWLRHLQKYILFMDLTKELF